MSARLHTWHCLRPCGQPWVCHPGPAAPIRSARQQRRHAVEIAVCKSPVPPTSHFPAGNVPSAKAQSRTCPPLPRPPPACETARLSRRCLSRKARRRVKTPDVLTDFDSCKGADGPQHQRVVFPRIPSLRAPSRQPTPTGTGSRADERPWLGPALAAAYASAGRWADRPCMDWAKRNALVGSTGAAAPDARSAR
jgi:hypothetical protein